MTVDLGSLLKFADKLGNDENIDKVNFTQLIKRETGTRFQVVNGKLKVISSVCDKFYYLFHKKEMDANVQSVIRNLIPKIEFAGADPVNRRILATLFSTPHRYFHRLSPTIFHQGLLSENIRSHFQEMDTTNPDKTFIDLVKFAERLDASNRANFLSIIHRAPGTKFRVDINTLTPVRSLTDKIYYFEHSTKIDNSVREVIKNILTNISKISSRADKQILDTIFLKNGFYFNRLSKSVFNRADLSQELVKILNPSLYAKKEELNSYYKDHPEMKYASLFHSEEEYNFRVASVDFSQALGMEFERNGTGTSGSYKCKGYNGEVRKDEKGNNEWDTLLLFKPRDEGPESRSNPHLFIKVRNLVLNMFAWVPGAGRRTCFFPDQGYLAEAAASEIDRELKIGIIPFTSVDKFRSKRFFPPGVQHFNKTAEKIGSCQIWVNVDTTNKDLTKRERVQDSQDVFNLSVWLPPYLQQTLIKQNKESIEAALPKEQHDLWAFVHMLTANTDGHAGNGLIVDVYNHEQKKLVKKFVAIDFGWALPFMHPNDSYALRNMYGFSYLPFSDEPFNPQIDSLAQKAENQFTNICLRIGNVYKKYQVTDFRSPGHLGDQGGDLRNQADVLQVQIMWQRLQRIRWAINNKKSIKECAEVKTPEDFRAFFHSKDGKDYNLHKRPYPSPLPVIP